MKKYKFVFWNLSGDFLGLAQRIQKEGYECFSYYEPELLTDDRDTGKGITYLVDDLFDTLNNFKDTKDEVIILVDDNSKGDTCDYLRSEGWKVIGSSHFADMAEHERELGNALAKKIGLETPPTWTFKDFASGTKFLEDLGKKYPGAAFVFKGNGIKMAGGAKTYVSRDLVDALWFMNWVEKDQDVHHYKVEEFELQLKIDGTEADFASWFNGKMFINNIAMDFEEKKLNGKGSAQGCWGQVECFNPAADNKFFRKYLSKLAPILAKHGEINEWAANTIIEDKDNIPKFLEWTPRFGWDSTMGELAILQAKGRSIAQFFITLAEGKQFSAGYFPNDVYSCSLRLYSESPGVEGKDVCGKPIHWDPKIEDNLWWYSIREREGQYELTDNPFGVIVATGKSIEEAIKNVYELVDPKNGYLSTPDIMYNEYIGQRGIKELEKLKKLGWF